MNPFLGFILNLVLPWDFFFAFLASRYRESVASSLPDWLERFFQLEALGSLAGFAALHPDLAFPHLNDPDAAAAGRPPFQAAALGHPLLPPSSKVTNDYTITECGQIAIITGSNMAGKSTFIKTVGINLCLAYAGGPVDAASLHTIPFRLHTCIRISDSITDGFSYFYAEVRCLKRLLERVREDHPIPLLYLVDEIFRGTNNLERLVGSRSYIRSLLGANAAGLIATHDLELASMAESSPLVHNFHFRDRVQDGRLQFDYKIRPGPSPTTNALKIMEMEGLPVDPPQAENG